MSQYYKDNSVYAEIASRRGADFAWAAGNAWNLLYADADASLRAIVSIRGHSSYVVKGAMARADLAEEKAAYLAAKANLAFFKITFDDDASEVQAVTVNGPGYSKPREMTLPELKVLFGEMQLPIAVSTTSKAVNDKTSSAYHNWQRTNLGALKVSDLDLLRLDGSYGHPIEIIELKRSYISLERWAPYPADFTNFNLVFKLAQATNTKFTIAYNVRETKPWNDDASRISLFSYTIVRGPKHLGIYSFDDFYNGNYDGLNRGGDQR